MQNASRDQPRGVNACRPAFRRLKNIPKTNRFRGVKRRQSAHVGQPNLLLSRLLLSAPEFHRIMPPWRLVGFTTDRELHPAPKVDIRLSKIIPNCLRDVRRTCRLRQNRLNGIFLAGKLLLNLVRRTTQFANYSAFTMHSTGQTEAHCGVSW